MSMITTSIHSTNSQTPASANPAQGLGQADFLKLLTVQMKNQDPMKPTDNNAFIAQMAQFAELSAVQDIKSSVTALSNRLQDIGTASALNFIGKTVLVDKEQTPRRVIGLVGAEDGGAPLLQLDDKRILSVSRLSALAI